jgi:hypothetical protein
MQLEQINMIRKKCNVCGTLHPPDHIDICNVCAEDDWMNICEKHPNKLDTPPVIGCSGCEEATRLEREREEGTAGISIELRKALESCFLYLIALDHEISSDEQHWVDKKLGDGAADDMIQMLLNMDWKKHFDILHVQLLALSEPDKEYMLTKAKPIFLELLSHGDLTKTEFDRLQDLMDFIGESLSRG